MEVKPSDQPHQHGPEKSTQKAVGYSLVELLLVVGIIGLILWVILPVGLRARVEARYAVVRQSCSELASYTSQWAQQAILANEDLRSSATLADYYASLAGLSHAPAQGTAPGEWLANRTGPTNWRHNGLRGRPIDGRYLADKSFSAPESAVEDMIPPAHPILNPFTETSVFDGTNHPLPESEGGSGAVPGAIAFGCGRDETDRWVYFAFVFQGVHNRDVSLDGKDTFLPEMNLTTVSGLRAGVFAARLP